MMDQGPVKDWPPNPFVVQGEVWEDDRFFGQSLLIGEILMAAQQPLRPWRIHLEGPRRIGKSSVARRAELLLRQDGYPVVFKDGLLLRAESEHWERGALGRAMLGRVIEALEVAGELAPGTLPRQTARDAFREHALKAIGHEFHRRRPVVILDEMDALGHADPSSLLDIVSAFTPDVQADRQPLLILVWGRAWGMSAEGGLISHVARDAMHLEVRELDDKAASDLLEKPVAALYGYDADCLNRLFDLTRGHPLYLAALGSAIFAGRVRRPAPASEPVTVEEAEGALAEALRRAEPSLRYAWSQLTAEQQLLARAIVSEERTGRADGVSASRAAEVLRESGRVLTRRDFGLLLDGLADNLVLDRRDGTYGLHAGFLAAWISDLTFAQIEAEAAGGNPAAWEALQTGLRAEAEGQTEEALEAFSAAAENPYLWQAAIGAARVLTQLGLYDEALGRLRGLEPRYEVEPEVAGLYRTVLLRRAETAWSRGEDPDTWLEELARVDPDYHRSPGAWQLTCKIERTRWERTLRNVDVAVRRKATEIFRERLPGRWWREACIVYCDALRLAVMDASEAPFAAALTADVFPSLLAFAPVPDQREQAAEILAALEAAEDTAERREALHTARMHLRVSTPSDGAPSLRDAWELTLGLLETTARDATSSAAAIPPLLIDTLIRAAPPWAEDRLRRLTATLLPARLATILDEAPEQAATCVRLIRQSRDRAAQHRAREIVEDHLLSVLDGSDDRLRRLFTYGAGIFAQVLEASRGEAAEESAALVRSTLDQVQMLLNQLHVVPAEGGRGEWDLILEGAAAVPEWNRLLALFEASDPQRAANLRRLLDIPAATIEKESVTTARAPGTGVQQVHAEEARLLHQILGAKYTILDRVPYERPGIPSGIIRAYEARRDEEPVLVRVYPLYEGATRDREFLRWLWENEQRALYNLSSRPSGTAVTRLRHATFLAEHGMLLLVTESVGTWTLRDELDRGRLGFLSPRQRGSLWRHLHALIEGLAALHRAGYLHRAVRPDNVFADRLAENVTSRPWLKLGNFEWAVYLQALGRAEGVGRYLDAYVAPEAVVAELRAEEGFAFRGETFSSDIFGLGLLLFECLVRPLGPSELRRFRSRHDYKLDDHRAWITGLRTEAQHAWKERGDLLQDELGLVLDLLGSDPRDRPADLDSTVEIARALALRGPGVQDTLRQRPLVGITTLGLRHESCIVHFLDHEISLGKIMDTDAVRRILEAELAGAEVHINLDSDKPLLLIGKNVNFTAEPFVYEGTRHHSLAWIEVARNYTAPRGRPVAILEAGVKMYDVATHMLLQPLFAAGGSWEDLFALAEHRADGLPPASARFLTAARMAVELERELWARSIFPYQIVAQGEDDGPTRIEWVDIRDPRSAEESTSSRTCTLLDGIVQLYGRDAAWYELGERKDATVPFDNLSRWTVARINEEAEVIRLVRLHRPWVHRPPPREGFVRPWMLDGSSVLYQRRRLLLRQLLDDAFLLGACTNPGELAEDLRLDPLPEFNKQLDDDKKALVRAARNRRPVFVVQGPPGTGKTTFAAEIVLQALRDNPTARILVTSQSHEPLNNLLDLVDASLQAQWRTEARLAPWQVPMCVRLLPEERLTEARHGESAVRIREHFHPSARAALAIEGARRWRPGMGQVKDPEVLDAWQRLLEREHESGLSLSLQDRIVRSAGLVFATTNDRSLQEFREDSFDLVILEEAAKAYAIEMLAPMRLARRWLLIGDQAQLPPFGVEDFEGMLKDVIAPFAEEDGKGEPREPRTNNLELRDLLTELLSDQQGAPTLTRLEDAKRIVLEQANFFGVLYEACKTTHPPLSARLNKQWRMHPAIRGLVSELFYGRELQDGNETFLRRERAHRVQKPDRLRDKALVWLDVPHASDDPDAHEEARRGGGFANGYEGRVLIGFLKEVVSTLPKGLSTALLTPYRAQVDLLRRLFATWERQATGGTLAHRVHTVDSFQGRQAALVAVSLVRNNHAPPERHLWGIGFLADPRRSNVMFSRAERLLVVVGSHKHFERFDCYVNDVYDYIAHHKDGIVIPGAEFLRDEDRARARVVRERVGHDEVEWSHRSPRS